MVNWTRRTTRIGVDLDAAGFRAVEISDRESGPAGSQVIQRWESADAAAQAEQLRKALAVFAGRSLHVGIAGPEILLKRLTLPPLPPSDVPEAARWQLKDQASFPVGDAYLSALPIPSKKTEKTSVEVLVALASPSAVGARLSLFAATGKSVKSMVPRAVALFEGMQVIAGETTERAVAVMDIGWQATNLVIGSAGAVRVARDLSVGRNTLAGALIGTVSSEHGRMQIDEALASALTQRHGVLATDESALSEEGIPLVQIAAMMRPVVEALFTEVRRFFEFYRVQLDEFGVSKLYLCGVGASVKGLPQLLSEGLAMPVEQLNPLPGNAEEGPQLVAAFGLATKRGESLNLLARSTASFASSGETPPLRQPLVLRGLFLWIGLLAASAVILLALVFQSRITLRRLEAEWKSMEPGYASYLALSREENRLRAILSAGESIRSQRPLWDGLLKEIAAQLPETVRLTAFHAEHQPGDPPFKVQIRFLAAVDPKEPEPQAALVALGEAMEASPFFSNVRLARSERPADPDKPLLFEMACHLE